MAQTKTHPLLLVFAVLLASLLVLSADGAFSEAGAQPAEETPGLKGEYFWMSERGTSSVLAGSP